MVDGLCAAGRVSGSEQKPSYRLCEQDYAVKYAQARRRAHAHTPSHTQPPDSPCWSPSVEPGIWGGRALRTHGFQGFLSMYAHLPDHKKHNIYSDINSGFMSYQTIPREQQFSVMIFKQPRQAGVCDYHTRPFSNRSVSPSAHPASPPTVGTVLFLSRRSWNYNRFPS